MTDHAPRPKILDGQTVPYRANRYPELFIEPVLCTSVQYDDLDEGRIVLRHVYVGGESGGTNPIDILPALGPPERSEVERCVLEEIERERQRDLEDDDDRQWKFRRFGL